jgi:methionyl-tRNA synthetase
VVPARHDELAPDAGAVLAKVTALLRQNELQDALVAIWSLVTRANQYIDQTAPFKLAKDPAQAARLDQVLYNLIECCRVLGILIAPYLPGTAEKIFAQLNLGPVPPLLSEAQWGKLAAGHKVGDPVPLFPRKDQPTK